MQQRTVRQFSCAVGVVAEAGAAVTALGDGGDNDLNVAGETTLLHFLIFKKQIATILTIGDNVDTVRFRCSVGAVHLGVWIHFLQHGTDCAHGLCNVAYSVMTGSKDDGTTHSADMVHGTCVSEPFGACTGGRQQSRRGTALPPVPLFMDNSQQSTTEQIVDVPRSHIMMDFVVAATATAMSHAQERGTKCSGIATVEAEDCLVAGWSHH